MFSVVFPHFFCNLGNRSLSLMSSTLLQKVFSPRTRHKVTRSTKTGYVPFIYAKKAWKKLPLQQHWEDPSALWPSGGKRKQRRFRDHGVFMNIWPKTWGATPVVSVQPMVLQWRKSLCKIQQLGGVMLRSSESSQMTQLFTMKSFRIPNGKPVMLEPVILPRGHTI